MTRDSPTLAWFVASVLTAGALFAVISAYDVFQNDVITIAVVTGAWALVLSPFGIPAAIARGGRPAQIFRWVAFAPLLAILIVLAVVLPLDILGDAIASLRRRIGKDK